MMKFYNPRDKRIHEKLKFIGPGPAAFFRDANKIIYDENLILESEVHLVSHLFREIESAVRNAVRLPEEKKDSHKDDIRYILEKLEIPGDHPISEAWIKFADIDFDFQFNKLVHRDALLSPRERKDEIEKSWEDFLGILDIVIEEAQQNYFQAIDEIDKLLTVKFPGEKEKKHLSNNIPINDTTLSYLFDKCDNPNWLKIFTEIGFFKNPPRTVFNDDGSWRYPAWPAGKFLQKMAAIRPKEVSVIIEDIPETENLNAIDDLAYSLCQLPSEVALKHDLKVLKWIKKGSLSYRSEPYFEYCLLLAQNKQTSKAINLLKAILTPEFKEKEHGKISTRSSNNLKISDYEFKTFFTKRLSDFIPELGFNIIKLFVEVLDTVLSHEYDGMEPTDYSHSWMESIDIDQSEFNVNRYDIKETLFNNTISVANKLIESNDITLMDFSRLLEEYDWNIFTRLNFLLISREGNLEKIGIVLTDKANFDNYGLRPEYRILLNKHFNSLSNGNKNEILNWIKSGPDRELIIRILKQWNDDVNEENVKEYKRQWQSRRLFPIADYLDSDLKQYYVNLIDEFGEPNFERSKAQSYVGPSTPKTIPELKKLSVADLVDYLNNWEPEEGFGKPSPEGLGRTLSSLIAEDAYMYSKQALLFKDLEPTYVRSFFDGIRTSAEKNEAIFWHPVLELMGWALKQPVDYSQTYQYQSKDLGWGWCRSTISDVLKAGCYVNNRNNIPIKYQKQVWSYIQILTKDPEPDIEYEKQYEGSNMSPSSLSINTTRGKAMHALFSYCWWVKEQSQHQDDNFSLDCIPEAKKVLEQHLDTKNEPTLTIRSVYGQHIPALYSIDKKWLKDQIDTIFPALAEQKRFRQSAWETYILYNKPYDDVFEVLKSEYQKEVNSLHLHADDEEYNHADRRLIEHLIIFYWRGIISFEDSLLISYWENAPKALLAYAFEFFEKCLRNWNGEFEDEFEKRLYDYIDYRISQNSIHSTNIDHRTELETIGGLFTAKLLDKKKRISYLLDTLRLTSTVKHGYRVISTLNEEFAEEFPNETIESLDIMIKGLERTMDLHAWRSDLKKIFPKLLSATEEVTTKTSKLIQYICQKDYNLMKEFKPLL